MGGMVFSYVINAPYFWISMGMVTAVAIFVGAIIYDGNLTNATKGLISIILYAVLLIQVDYSRLQDLFINFPEKIDKTRYAGILSILFITFFWLLGMFLGVSVSYLIRKIHRKKVDRRV